jgi:hypothetical protein
VAEILIHRCRLRVVRHGGWSWGPDPRGLLQAAVRALPALLAAALEGLYPGDDEREIAAPVRLRLRVGRSELLAALAGLPPGGSPLPGDAAPALALKLRAALAEALGTEPPSGPPAIESPPALLPEAIEEETETAPPSSILSLGGLLRSWRDSGGLAPRLALLSERVLDAWRVSLQREAERSGRAPLSSEAGERLLRAAAGLATAWPAAEEEDRAAALRVWLAAAVELSARCGIAAGHPAVERALAAACPEIAGRLIPPAEKETPARDPGPPRAPGAGPAPFVLGTGAAALPEGPASIPWRSVDAEVHVDSALPFLLLGPLSRTGYLETLAALLPGADLPLFAAALAYKVLPPPERGWRRQPAAARAAAAFAGLAEPAPESALSDLARRASPCFEPLNAGLAAPLLAGHEPGRPLLIAAAGGGLLLAEADGVFPIAWADGLDGLRPVLSRLRDETFLVPAEAAAPGLLRRLDRDGCRFVTPAVPTRGEPWRPLRLPAGGRVWSNDPARPGLARQAVGLETAAEGARRLWQALAADRPSAPRAADPSFDRHLTLAAAVALGTLAWTLWREREPVDPVLALERFGDLDARVLFRARSVHVLLPMGRRHGDLFQHRLLEPVRDAVWLGGRVLEFGGG